MSLLLATAPPIEDMQDIAPLVETWPATPFSWHLYLAGPTVAAIAILLVWRFWGLRKRPEEAWTAALNALVHLEATSSDGSRANFYDRLNPILRGYLARRYSVPLMRRTTEELLADMVEIPGLNVEQKSTLGSLLKRSDQARFSSALNKADDRIEALQMARSLIFATLPTEPNREDRVL